MAKNKKTEAPVPEDVEAETAQAPEEVPEGADTPGPEEAPEQEAPKAEEKPRKDQGQLLAEAADELPAPDAFSPALSRPLQDASSMQRTVPSARIERCFVFIATLLYQ